MKIDENQEKSNFNTKSFTSIPFGGPIVSFSESTLIDLEPTLIRETMSDARVPVQSA